MQASHSVERRQCVLLLERLIGKLPPVQKKVLAMYYFENLPLSDIAARFGLSKIEICQILVETSATLFLAIRQVSLLKGCQKATPDQQGLFL